MLIEERYSVYGVFCKNSYSTRTTLRHKTSTEHLQDDQPTSYAKTAVLSSLERQPLGNQSNKA